VPPLPLPELCGRERATAESEAGGALTSLHTPLTARRRRDISGDAVLGSHFDRHTLYDS